MTDISKRKADHINLALQAEHQASKSGGFERIRFEHNCLPELHTDEIDCSTVFLNQQCSAPLIIGSMTGGCERGESINRHLAEAAEQCKIPMALGSQRAALQDGLAQDMRRWAPNAILLGNLGGTLKAAKAGPGGPPWSPSPGSSPPAPALPTQLLALATAPHLRPAGSPLGF